MNDYALITAPTTTSKIFGFDKSFFDFFSLSQEPFHLVVMLIGLIFKDPFHHFHSHHTVNMNMDGQSPLQSILTSPSRFLSSHSRNPIELFLALNHLLVMCSTVSLPWLHMWQLPSIVRFLLFLSWLHMSFSCRTSHMKAFILLGTFTAQIVLHPLSCKMILPLL